MNNWKEFMNAFLSRGWIDEDLEEIPSNSRLLKDHPIAFKQASHTPSGCSRIDHESIS